MAGPAFFSGVINIAKNEVWKVRLQYLVDYTVSGDPTNVQPLDLTDSTFAMQLRRIEADPTAVVDVTTGDGIEITDTVQGEFEITISLEKLRRLHAGEYSADIIRFDPMGDPERLWEGKAIVVDGTTREKVIV